MSTPITCPRGHTWDPGPVAPTFPIVCPTCGSTVSALDTTLPFPSASADQAPSRATGPSAGLAAAVPRHAPAAEILPSTQDTGPLDMTLMKAPTTSTGRNEAEMATVQVSAQTLAAAQAAPIGNYQILDLIGRGGMGVVYKALQVKLNRLVALKMILSGAHASPQEQDRFRLEAEAVAQLQHPNIVQIYEVGEQEGKPYLSLEYVDGGSLAALLHGQPMEARRAASLVRQLALGIHEAHLRGIIHRDLKPANILMTSAGVPKIADFGLAKHLSDLGRTLSGAVVGTPNYMAPEQAQGQNKLLGPHTDVYALGAILYHLLTGKPPFEGDSVLSVLRQVENHDALPPRQLVPQVPRDLETICLKCLEKQPGKRYQSADELAEELHRFLRHEPIQARPVGTLERCVKWCRRRPERAALIVVSIVSVVATALSLVLLREEQALRPTASTQPHERTYTPAELRSNAAIARRALFSLLQKSRTPAGWYPADLDPKAPLEIEVRAHARTLCALLRSPDVNNEQLRDLLSSLELPFAPGQAIEVDGVKFGWRSHVDVHYAQADPALWLVTALALALGRPGLIPDEQRPRFEAHLLYAQEVLHNYRSTEFTGGWNTFARQKEMHRHNTYTSALALRALVECYRAELPWEGSPKQRDELIKKTAGWLLRNYRNQEKPPGWNVTNDAASGVQEGLTLNVYAALLHANAEFGVEVDDALRDDIEELLERIMVPELVEHDHATMEFSCLFLDQHGKERLGVDVSRSALTPWAIECAVYWFQGAAIYRESPEDIALMHRRLGRLVVGSATRLATYEVQSRAFVPAERLYGLSSVPAKEVPEKRKR